MLSKRQVEARLDRYLESLIVALYDRIKRPGSGVRGPSKALLRARFRDLQVAALERRRLDAVRIANELAELMHVEHEHRVGDFLQRALLHAAIYRQMRTLP